MVSHEVRSAIKSSLKLFAAHHPLCDWFAADRFGRRVPFCSGCIITWPLALASAVLGTLWISGGADVWAVLAAGCVGGLPQASTLVYRGGRLWRGAVKAVGGIGIGLAGAAFLRLPLSPLDRLGVMVAVTVLAVAFLAFRFASIVKVCDACPWQRDWEHCPGFGMQDAAWRPVAEGNH